MVFRSVAKLIFDQGPCAFSKNMDAKVGFAVPRIRVRPAKGFDPCTIDQDDFASTNPQSIVGEHLERSRQCLGLHPDTRRKLVLGKRDLGDCTRRPAVMQAK